MSSKFTNKQKQLIKSIPKNTIELLTLHYIDGYSYRKIGEMNKIHEATVRYRIKKPMQ